MNEDETPSTPADIMALAEQAEAEAAEAEALAVAARARARAIQLRREAELVEAKEQEPASEEPAEDGEPEPADTVETQDAPTIEAGGTRSVDAEDVETRQDETPEDVDVAAAEPDGDVSPAEVADKKRVRRWLRRPKWSSIAAALAIIVIVAALSGVGYMVKEHRDAVRQRQRAAEFAAAARQGVVTLTSMDFKHAKESVQRIVDDSTGSFKDDFLKMADDFVKVVEQSKVVSRGTVQAAAVELDSMTADSATVLVASTSEVTNAAGAKQDPRSYRLIVTVTRDGGQIKISKVEFVP